MYQLIFNSIKNIIPKISETELIALRSGGTHIDRDLFSGKILPHRKKCPPVLLSETETQRWDQRIQNLLRHVGEDSIYPNKRIMEIMKKIGESKMMGMIIYEKYGGVNLSITQQSKILTKIASYNPSLAVAIMVPNSLGPGELLQKYGTKKQQDEYLPSLAKGDMIPCFGLTGPENGSDATGKIDQGTVVVEDGKYYVDVTINKRYITLAPISNLIGLAIMVKDPNKLLKNGKEGVSLFLLENTFPGLQQDSFHNPNDAGFPNGTLTGTLRIPIQQTIGGPNCLGEGWKMLMECLAVGRGVSLPATANGTVKTTTLATMQYANIRKQFKIPISRMEGVQEKLSSMIVETWIIHCCVQYTNHILDGDSVPSVITAIAKQQCTERARRVLLNGMDIVAGSAICTGPNNIFTKFYRSAPVGITVEGSNTLTRSLIIFGQGLNKSHPHIYNIYDSIVQNDLSTFKKHFNSIVIHGIQCFGKALIPSTFYGESRRFELAVARFANLANFVALLGGSIKSQQMLSGCMADVLSNLYLCSAISWYHHNSCSRKDFFLEEFCMNYLLKDAEEKMNKVIMNYPNPRIRNLLWLTSYSYVSDSSFQTQKEFVTKTYKNEKFLQIMNEDVYQDHPFFEKNHRLSNMNENEKQYEKLYRNIISVGEYPIEND